MTKFLIGGKGVVVDMPPATTGKYAAMRVAEHLGFDPEEHLFVLELWPSGPEIDQDEIVSDFDGQRVRVIGRAI